MGSKEQRQNQHASKLMRKIAKFKKKNLDTEGLEKELAHTLGGKKRPAFKTGVEADARHKRRHSA